MYLDWTSDLQALFYELINNRKQGFFGFWRIHFLWRFELTWGNHSMNFLSTTTNLCNSLYFLSHFRVFKPLKLEESRASNYHRRGWYKRIHVLKLIYFPSYSHFLLWRDLLSERSSCAEKSDFNQLINANHWVFAIQLFCSKTRDYFIWRSSCFVGHYKPQIKVATKTIKYQYLVYLLSKATISRWFYQFDNVTNIS